MISFASMPVFLASDVLTDLLSVGTILGIVGLAGVGLALLKKHWYRAAQVLFGVATLLADAKVLRWALTSDSGFKTRVGFGLLGILGFTATGAWAVWKVQTDISDEKAADSSKEIRGFYDLLTLEEKKALRFILPLRRSPTNLTSEQTTALQSIQEKTGFVTRNYTTGSYEVDPHHIESLRILLSSEPPDAPTIDKASDRLWITLRGQNVRFENQYFQRDEGYPFDETVTGGSPLIVKLRNLEPQVDAVVYAGAQAVTIKGNKLVDPPKRWDSNQSDRMIEIVDEKQRAVFQLVFDAPNHITVDGVFSPRDKPDRLTTRFKYPSKQYPSEYKLRE